MKTPIQIALDAHALLFATLLVEVATVAMVASLLLRYRRFTRLLLLNEPDLRERSAFGVTLGVIAALGAWARLSLGYTGADVAVAMPLLAGFIMGWIAGAWAGGIAGIIPLLHGEILALPAGIGIGVAAGLSRRLLSEPADIWLFSPVPFGNTVHAWRRLRDERVLDARVLVLVVGAIAEIGRTEVGRMTGRRWLFSFRPDDAVSYYAVIFACLACVGISLKIWNTPRIEAHIRRQEALLAEARFDALRSQVNPHFLFNTLNTVISLIRTHPEQARSVIVKLSTILRRLLYNEAAVASLRAELEVVDDYLGIEQIRFGSDRLCVERDIDPPTLGALVPTMLLQPLVENAIKHGITGRERGGTIRLRARQTGPMLDLVVEDDGVGMTVGGADDPVRRGIGLTNVRERLRSLYGDLARFEIASTPGTGTTVHVRIPFRLAGRVARDTGGTEGGSYIGDRETRGEGGP